MLELKPHATPEAETAAAEAAVKMVNDNRLAKRVTYITFSRHAMEELIRLAPKNDVLYLGGDISPEELEAMGAAGGDYNHGVYPVSYTHLDVYKRQSLGLARRGGPGAVPRALPFHRRKSAARGAGRVTGEFPQIQANKAND